MVGGLHGRVLEGRKYGPQLKASVEVQPNFPRDRVLTAIITTWSAGRSRSCDRVPGENPDQIFPQTSPTSSSIMDARERLEVEDEDGRKKRLGAGIIHDTRT